MKDQTPAAIALAPDWSPPQFFDEYRLVRPVGRGGMGRVYLAHDSLLDRLVAVKFIAKLEPDSEARARFLLEARAAARLQHPNVVAVYRVGELDHRPYIVSEFVRGQSLEDLVTPISSKRVLELALGVARGLAAAHHQGVLHRDIKPANVIIAEDGAVKLIDFGLAKLVGAHPPLPALEPARASGLDPGPAIVPRTALGPSVIVGSAAETAQFAGPTPPPVTEPVASAAAPRLTRVGVLLGTPEYMPPEVLRGQAATRRSDVYSLGVLLYELSAGRPPHRAPEAGHLGELLHRIVREGAAPLIERAPGIDPRLAAVVDRCLKRDPADRFASAEELLAALEQLVPQARGTAIPEGNPYRGLQPFEAEHRALYFGRTVESRAIVARLRAEPFVLVAGDSGVGKTSLCRAGVLPLLAEGALEDGRTWSVVRLFPGRRPLVALGDALASALHAEGHDVRNIEERIQQEPAELGREIGLAQGRERGLVMFVDQLEELLTLSEWADAVAVGRLLGRLASGLPGVRLLATVRGDYLTRLAALPGLGEEITRAMFLLTPLSPQRVRDAIVGPAQATGVRFESEELVDEIVQSTSGAQGGLPLLQFALAELWEVRDRGRRIIPGSALSAIGGVAGALARHADGVLSALLPAQREAARRILVRLVSVEGTRARRTEEELVSDDREASAALAMLVRGRLLVAREIEGGTAYEVAHEALLEGWGTLRGWLETQLESREVRARLDAAAAEWERLGRSAEALWGDRQLAETTVVEVRDLGARERAFLDAAHRTTRRNRLLRTMLVIALPLCLAIAYGVFEIRTSQALDHRIHARVLKARQALARAVAARVRAGRLRAEAFGRFDARDRSGGEEIWTEALSASHDVERHYAAAGRAIEAALLLDPSRRDVRAMQADLLYARVLWSEKQRGQNQAELVARLGVYDDGGRRRAMLGAPARLVLESTPPGARVIAQAYREDRHGRMTLDPAAELGHTPLAAELRAGSYLLELSGAGRETVRAPILLSRGERARFSVPLPARGAVPAGYLFIPPGRFLFGSSDDERLRRGFMNASPLHTVWTGAYLISRYETTYADWIEYLNALPADERARQVPSIGAAGLQGRLQLEQLARGAWQLTIQPSTTPYTAVAGASIRYGFRSRRRDQNWLRFPVSGITWAQAVAYAAWLRRSGRLPGARLCSEIEWERAARGGDDRQFPHGNLLLPDDANHDVTYGRDPRELGPDEVGSHPASVSPFGAQDMMGNVWEWTRAVFQPDEPVARGGAYYYDEFSGRVPNRLSVEPTLHDLTLGVRVCAAWPSR